MIESPDSIITMITEAPDRDITSHCRVQSAFKLGDNNHMNIFKVGLKEELMFWIFILVNA